MPVDYLTRRQVSEEGGSALRFDYGDARARIRKSAETAHPTFWARGDGRPMRAYGHQLAEKFAQRPDKKILLIVEGESDTLTAWFHRRPCLGVAGATMTHTLLLDDVSWAESVYAVREPGDAGAAFVQNVARRLREVGYTGQIFEISLTEHKDVSDLHIAVEGDRERFAAELDAAIAAAVPIKEASQPGRTTLLSAAELLSSAEESIEYIVDGLLPKGGIMLLVGKPKCGKSVLARNLALATCRGSTFLGRRVEKATVLWLALEETRAQVSSAFRDMGLQPDDSIHFHFGHGARDAQAWLQATCQQVDAGLVVIDTWHKLTLIESVNDYGAVNRANQALQQLARERGVAQIWIHHSNKGISRNGSEVLGSQALFAAVDTLASMDRADDGTRTIWTIQRSGDDLEPSVVTMNDDQLVTIAGTKRENELARAEQRILDELGDEPVAAKDLKEAAGIRTTVFWSAINALARKGLVRRQGRGSRFDPFRYAVGNQNPLLGTSSSKTPIHLVPKVPLSIREPREPVQTSSGTSSEPHGTAGTLGTTGTAGNAGTSSEDELLDYAREVLGNA
ncbi:MAG TPA: AAA family ATPase [Candidatus Cybelea sp.]|nr:AAA family ATPase [Candidatus Cybelea sp.]